MKVNPNMRVTANMIRDFFINFLFKFQWDLDRVILEVNSRIVLIKGIVSQLKGLIILGGQNPPISKSGDR